MTVTMTVTRFQGSMATAYSRHSRRGTRGKSKISRCRQRGRRRKTRGAGDGRPRDPMNAHGKRERARLRDIVLI